MDPEASPSDHVALALNAMDIDNVVDSEINSLAELSKATSSLFMLYSLI